MFLLDRKQTAVLLSAALFNVPAMAAPVAKDAGKVFDAPYLSAPAVGEDQAQVVYYRAQGAVQRQSAAHVYVDREFHTGLLPGGHTTLCVAPGLHTLGAYLDDMPLYKGKHSDLYQASLQGGKTYFLKVREDGNTFPQPVHREEAERELATSRAQAHVVSRASAVEACRHYDYLVDTSRFKRYELSGDVVFNFGKSGPQDISAAGHQALNQLVSALRRDDAQIKQMQVVGHTDPIGDEAANQQLGQRRADTLRSLLIAKGIPESIISASSAGNREPVVYSCYGNREQRIACFAPNRRVVVTVELGQR